MIDDRVTASEFAGLPVQRREAVRRAGAYAFGLVPTGLLAALQLVDPRAAMVAGLAGLAAAGWWLLAAQRVAHRRRLALDEFILHGWRNLAPVDVDARVEELLSARHRRRLARVLENQLQHPALPFHPPQRRLILFELARQRSQIEALAGRLRDSSRPLDARGVVLLERLIADGAASPLYAGPRDAIGPALQRVQRALDGS